MTELYDIMGSEGLGLQFVDNDNHATVATTDDALSIPSLPEASSVYVAPPIDPNPMNTDLKERGPGQWVRRQILYVHPAVEQQILDGSNDEEFCIDINRDKRCDDNEYVVDYNDNGVRGDIEDFVRFYAVNRTTINRNIPFFRIAASLPGEMNPYLGLHDYLSLSYDSGQASLHEIEAVYMLVGGLVAHGQERFKTTDPNVFPKKHLKILYGGLVKEGMKYYVGGRVALLTDSVMSGLMDCDTSAFPVLFAARQLGMKNLFAIDAPSHLFLRYDDGERSFNVDVRGRVRSDAYYELHANIHPQAIANGVLMANLGHRALLAQFYVLHGKQLLKQCNPVGALQYAQAALALRSDDTFALGLLGTVYERMREYDKALNIFERRERLDPNNPYVYYRLGRVHRRSRQYMKAAQAFHDAGVLYEKLWGRDKYYRRAASCYFMSGEVYAKVKENVKAAANFNRAAKLYRMLGRLRDAERAFYLSGEAYDRAGNHNRAAREYRNAEKLNVVRR